MKHRSLWLFVLSFCLMCLFTLPVIANSAEPPCLTIVVVGAPEDLELSLVDADGAETVQLEKLRSSRGWETYFRYFYNHDFRFGEDVELTDLQLAVTIGGNTTLLGLPEETFEHYNNVLLLDLSELKQFPDAIPTQYMLRSELYPGRMMLVIGLRVLLTLLIEGILFWAFGYRQAYSWGMFFCINILTQLFLNLLIGSARMDSYVLVFYYLLEAVIILAEAIAFPLALQEKRGRSVPYAIAANLVSMFIGGMMIANLPLAL